MNIVQHQKTSSNHHCCQFFISSVIQFDKKNYPVVLYENDLICIFMNINENFSNERKNLRKNMGCTYKIINVSPTMCSSVSNLVPIKCLDIVR